MAKRPAILFYTGDWIKDTALRCCSIGARGMWIDMLCYMHDCQPYGHLKVGNKVILPVNLAALVGLTLSETEGYLQELIEAGVCAQKADGTIYSERMVRDEEIRLKRASGGIKGGNPLLKKPKPKKNKGLPKGYPSLEDDNEDENVDGNEGKGVQGETKLLPPKKTFSYCVMPWDSSEFLAAWENWKIYKKEQHGFQYKGNHSEQAALQELAKLSDGLENIALEILLYTIGRGWKGFVKPKKDEQTNPINGHTGGFNAAYKTKLAERMAAASGGSTHNGA